LHDPAAVHLPGRLGRPLHRQRHRRPHPRLRRTYGRADGRAAVITAVVTDIEGTTTSLAFVREVLFPYARQRLPAFVRARRAEPAVAAQLTEVQRLQGRALDVDELVETLLQWSDADAKVTPLKALQGAIWADGYAKGELVGHVYDDAAANLRAWHLAGVRLFVFSSGSVSSQQLLFRHSRAGDLT